MVLVGGAYLVISATLSLAAAAQWAESETAQESIARRIEAFVSDQIAGRMTIGGVDDMTPTSIRLRDVRFFAPDDTEVIYARELEAELDWSALLEGRVVITRGRARGGRILLASGPDGEIGMDTAFRTPGVRETPGAQANRPLDLDNIEVSGTKLTIAVADWPPVRAEGVRCVLHMWAPRVGAPVQLRARNLSARVNITTPIPTDFAIDGGTMRFDPTRRDRARIDVRGAISDVRVRLELDLGTRADPEQSNMRLTVPGGAGWLGASATILQLMAAPIIAPNLEFAVVFAPRRAAP